MKSYIKSFVALAAVGMASVSCLPEYSDTPVKYPDQPFGYGVYKSITSSDSTDYFTYIFADSTNHPQMAVIGQNRKANDKSAIYYFVSDSASYNKNIGVLFSSAPTCYYGDGLNNTNPLHAEAYLAQSNDGKNYTMQFITGSGKDGKVQFTKSTQQESILPPIGTLWASTHADGAYLMFFNQKNDSCYVLKRADGSTNRFKYTYENGIVKWEGSSVTGGFNAKKQLVFHLDGKDIAFYPQATESLPEEFELLGSGSLTFEALLNQPQDVNILKGSKGTYAIAPFLQSKAFYFKVGKNPEKLNIGDQTVMAKRITFEPQSTGVFLQKLNGTLWVRPYPNVEAYSPQEGVYILNCQLALDNSQAFKNPFTIVIRVSPDGSASVSSFLPMGFYQKGSVKSLQLKNLER